MRRRQLLAAATTGVVATAGCRGALTRSGALPASDGRGEDANVTDTLTMAASGRPADICERPLDPGDIVAIGEPAFANEWPETFEDGYRDLEPDSTVVGVTTPDGRARAYPLSVLYVNEVVNDDFGGPLLVTFCPLCWSGFVAERRVAGDPTPFDVTGSLWRPPQLWAAASEDEGRVRSNRESGVSRTANLLMYDLATESYWSQLLGQAICGPRRGDRLTVRPFAFTTWGDWRREHPHTDVLLPPPHSERVRQPPAD